MRKNPLIKKSWAIGTILLFLGTSIIPLADGLPVEKEHILVPENCSDDINITISGTLGENGWYVSAVTVTITGGNHTYFRIDNGSWFECFTPFVMSDDGIHLIEATDDFEHIVNATIKIDRTPPFVTQFAVIRIGFFKWKFVENVTDNASGTNRTVFSINRETIGVCTEPPYIVYWSGLMRLIFLKFNLFGDYYYLPHCIPYDNAGNSPMQIS
jgi:hypothetical protein